ncbi:hypothetical protein RB594_007040 [Gaeumannomyces avenae]
MAAEPLFMRDPPPGEERWAAGSLAATQQTVGAVTLGLATLVYGLRMYSRLYLTRLRLGWDDYLAGTAMVCGWGFYACTMGMIANGGCGRSMWQVTMSEFEELLKWTLPVNIFYMLTADLAKLSLLVLYWSLSPKRTYRTVVKMLIVGFILYGAIYACISLFGCIPFRAHWDLAAIPTARCVDKFSFFLAASVANVFMDMAILVIPLHIVMPLQVSRRQKASLFFLFGTGGSVIVIASYCCYLTVKLFSSDNYTRGLSHELSWMYAELAGCVICASASALKPFFTRFLPQLFGTAFSRSAGSGDGGTGLELSKGGGAGASMGSRVQRKTRRQMSQGGIELELGNDSEERLAQGRRDDGDRRPSETLISVESSSALGRAPQHLSDWTIAEDMSKINVSRQVTLSYEDSASGGHRV